MDPLVAFKNNQREAWAHFAPLESGTMIPAAKFVKFAGVKAGQEVLDVGCGTGVAAIPAARAGAKVMAIDLTPELLEKARSNATIAGLDIQFHEGDAENLSFADATFDVVLSQFGHIFAPRPEVATAEMLRVLKPGGTIAFNTWPPQLFVGQMFGLTARYMPPSPIPVPPPSQWGEKSIIMERLGRAIHDITFESGIMIVPALSISHYRAFTEKTVGPVIKLIAILEKSDPARLAQFRKEYDALAEPYFHDNSLHQEYLMTRATKG
jgi:ubiquinone/menaquinone biosynthesis C-methylase UbiE